MTTPRSVPVADAAALGELGSGFMRFADSQCGPYAPTYDRLARALASDPAAAACVLAARSGQQHPNLFLAAAHLLLGDEIRTMDGEEFLQWCHANTAQLAPLCASRLVQTNEVRRASFLLPGLAHVAGTAEQPLALVEVGAAAGLLLAFDRYRYEYRFTPEGTVAATAGDPASPVLVACDLHSSRLPPVELHRTVATRVGIDLAPVWPGDTEATDWLRALVWPDHPDRRARLDAALALVAADPVPLVRGDALDVLPEVVAAYGTDVTPVVFHHATVLHFDAADAARFRDMIPRLAASRGGDLVWLFAEGGSAAGLHLTVVDFRVPDPTPVLLADVQAHGAWLRWQPQREQVP